MHKQPQCTSSRNAQAAAAAPGLLARTHLQQVEAAHAVAEYQHLVGAARVGRPLGQQNLEAGSRMQQQRQQHHHQMGSVMRQTRVQANAEAHMRTKHRRAFAAPLRSPPAPPSWRSGWSPKPPASRQSWQPGRPAALRPRPAPSPPHAARAGTVVMTAAASKVAAHKAAARKVAACKVAPRKVTACKVACSECALARCAPCLGQHSHASGAM